MVDLNDDEEDSIDDLDMDDDINLDQAPDIQLQQAFQIPNEEEEFKTKQTIPIHGDFFSNIPNPCDCNHYRRLKFLQHQTDTMESVYIARTTFANLQIMLSHQLNEIGWNNLFWKECNSSYVTNISNVQGDITKYPNLSQDQQRRASASVSGREQVAKELRNDFGASYMVTDFGMYILT